MDVKAMIAAIAENIERSGQHMFGVFGDEPEQHFMYTIGNHQRGLPELICIGPFPQNVVGTLLNQLGETQREKGEPYAEGDHDIGWSMPMRIRKCGPSVGDYVAWADNYYDEPVEVMQVMIPDKEGKYPDDDGVAYPFNVAMP